METWTPEVESRESRVQSRGLGSSPRQLAMKFRFEKIEAWQMARGLNGLIYEVTKRFPREELNNIAEKADHLAGKLVMLSRSLGRQPRISQDPK